MRRPRNRFDIEIVYPDVRFSTKNRPEVELTPEQVADELEAVCRRIRNYGRAPTDHQLALRAREEAIKLLRATPHEDRPSVRSALVQLERIFANEEPR